MTTTAIRTRLLAPRAPWARLLAHALVLAAAIGLWLVALGSTDIDAMRGLGLIDALPPAYFAAVLLALGGAVAAALARRPMPRIFVVHLGALIVFLHGTTPLLYEEPRYPWVYKHLGVIDYIQMHGAVDRSIDIYNNWPGFFAANSLLSDVTGLSPESYAAWAQIFFAGVTALAAAFAIRPLLSDPRPRMLAVLLVVAGDWVGQNYLSPQALALPLMLVVLGLWLRLPAGADADGRTGRVRARIGRGTRRLTPPFARPRHAGPAAPAAPPLDLRLAFALAALPALAVVLIHQLTPIVLLMSTAMLALCTGRRLWRAVGVLVVAEIIWIGLAWPYLTDRISLLHFSGVPSPAPEATAPPLPNADLTALSSRLTVLVVILVALAGVVRRLRGGRDVAAPLALVAAPILLVPLQSYGGEAGIRAYLFALPWLAVLASDALVGVVDRAKGPSRRAVRTVAVGAAVAAVCGLTLVAYFGHELENYVGPEDVHASTWFEDTAPDGAVLAFVAPGFPNRISGRYADLAVSQSAFSPALSDDPYTRPLLLDQATRVEAVRGLMQALPEKDRYLAIGPSQERGAELYGILPAQVVEAIPRELEAQPDFTVVYDEGGTIIFRYDPPAS
ncbi:MAG TPA: hypothetical protein VFG74_12785 [Miltoncostaeaceae bacterium]|nr:hypothetical protein [Miltoncostaeaceae bacterium]